MNYTGSSFLILFPRHHSIFGIQSIIPSRGFLFFYYALISYSKCDLCFRPLTGISLFLYCTFLQDISALDFSSPHGDFSFSIKIERRETIPTITFSSPHGDFSFSMIDNRMIVNSNGTVFVPSRGFLFFYAYLKVQPGDIMEFSSPHGDFSFSIKEMTLDTMLTLFSSPHGDFSFSIKVLTTNRI